MVDFTAEQELEIQKRISQAQRIQHIADNGVVGFTISLEYLNDQVKRGIIPQSVFDVMDMVCNEFKMDMGIVPRPQKQESKPEPTAEQ